VWQLHADYHSAYGDAVKVETAGFSICKTEIVISWPLIELSWRYLVCLWTLTFWIKWRHPIWYGSKIAPQLPPSWKSSDPILVKCGMLTQNEMTVTTMRS